MLQRLEIPTSDFHGDLKILTELGFRLDKIYPSDDPVVADMSGHGISLRMDRNSTAPPVLPRLIENPERYNNGFTDLAEENLIEMEEDRFQLVYPRTRHKFQLRRLLESDHWVVGRAGMLYRDLIPDRLGGSIAASHIRIPDGGPVPDMVHYHTVGFQLIFCYRGWVRLVYEDQGAEFILSAGECVTQPPEIRHRVLEASDNLQVIEIAVPADHMTTIDHEMELPNNVINRDRLFKGQKFCRHQKEQADWRPWRFAGFEAWNCGIDVATNGRASVRVAQCLRQKTTEAIAHSEDIHFTFVLVGDAELEVGGERSFSISEGDTFLIPPGMNYRIHNAGIGFELLEVSLGAPERFEA